MKHKMRWVSVVNPIGTLDMDEKARAKDTFAQVHEENSSVNPVHKKNFQSHKFEHMYEGKEKFEDRNKTSQTTNFKKKGNDKRKGACHVYGDPEC